MLKDPVSRLSAICDSSALDGILFTDLRNIRYLTGFSGTDAVLLFHGERLIFLTDSRYGEQAKTQVRADDVRIYGLKNDGIAEAIEAFGLQTVGFEAEHLTVAALRRIRERCGQSVAWQPLEEQLKGLRSVKSPSELASLERAAQMNAQAFEAILPLIRPGARESSVARELEFELRRLGGEEKSFDFIVASGPRGALPHGVASEREIKSGELVTIDFGTVYQGFHSDETVTLAVGEISDKLKHIYEVVLEAHDRAASALKPGVELSEIDAIARELIRSEGYGDYFGHGLGHGVGLDVHEEPVLNTRSQTVAAEGMVVTVEPGIYIPDLGGVRIEDMYVITDSGARALTKIPKDFRMID